MKAFKVKSNILLLLTLLLTLGVNSCTEDLSEKSDGKSNGESNGFLTLYISTIKYATRDGSQVAATEEEKKINSLFLYLFNEDETLYRKVTLKENAETENTGYGNHEIKDISKGKYYAVITANIEDYIKEPDKLTENINKSELENLVLTFKNRIEADNLPMVWFSDNPENDSQTSDGKITIEDNTVIESTLTFLCAKVRLTVLFDYSGVENVEASLEAYVSDVVSNTSLKNIDDDSKDSDILDSNDENNGWEINLGKYEYPENYPKQEGSGSEEVASDLTEKLKNKNNNKFAWQGIIYIPENLTNKPSKIKAKLTVNGEEKDKELYIHNGDNEINSHEILRGNMYDITLEVTKPQNFIYRVYWPVDCGPSLYIKNFKGVYESIDGNASDFEKSKNIGVLWQDLFYYHEFQSTQSLDSYFTCQFIKNGIEGEELSNLKIADCFTPLKIDNKIIYVGYIQVDSNNNPYTVSNSFPLSIHTDDFIDFYWDYNLKVNNIYLPWVSLWIGEIREQQILLQEISNAFYYQGKPTAIKSKTYYQVYGWYMKENCYTINFQFAEQSNGINFTDPYSFSVWDSNVSVIINSDKRKSWTVFIDELP